MQTTATQNNSQDKKQFIKKMTEAYNDSQFDEVLSWCTGLEELDPHNIKVFHYRGCVYFFRKEYEQSIRMFDSIINLYQDCVGAYFNRGLVYFTSGEDQKALDDFNRFLTLNQNAKEKAIAYDFRAELYFRLNRKQDAIADYIQAIESDPTFELIYNGINPGLKHQKKLNDELNIEIKIGKLKNHLTAIFENKNHVPTKKNQVLKCVKDFLLGLQFYVPNLAKAVEVVLLDELHEWMRIMSKRIPQISLIMPELIPHISLMLLLVKKGKSILNMPLGKYYFGQDDFCKMGLENVDEFIFSFDLPKMVQELIRKLIYLSQRKIDLTEQKKRAQEWVNEWMSLHQNQLLDLSQATLKECLDLLENMSHHPKERGDKPEAQVLSHSLQYLRGIKKLPAYPEPFDVRDFYHDSRVYLSMINVFEEAIHTKKRITDKLMEKMKHENWCLAQALELLIDFNLYRQSVLRKKTKAVKERLLFRKRGNASRFGDILPSLSINELSFLQSMVNADFTNSFLSLSKEEKREITLFFSCLNDKMRFENKSTDDHFKASIVCETVKDQILYLLADCKEQKLKIKKEQESRPEEIKKRLEASPWNKLPDEIKQEFVIETRAERGEMSGDVFWNKCLTDSPDRIDQFYKDLFARKLDDQLIQDFAVVDVGSSDKVGISTSGSLDVCVYFETPRLDGVQHYYFRLPIYTTFEELKVLLQKKSGEMNAQMESNFTALDCNGWPFKKDLVTKQDYSQSLNALLIERYRAENGKPSLKNNFVQINVKSSPAMNADSVFTTSTASTSSLMCSGSRKTTEEKKHDYHSFSAYFHDYFQQAWPEKPLTNSQDEWDGLTVNEQNKQLAEFQKYSQVRESVLTALIGFGQFNQSFAAQQKQAVKFVKETIQKELLDLDVVAVGMLLHEFKQMASAHSIVKDHPEYKDGLLSYLRVKEIKKSTGNKLYSNTDAYNEIVAIFTRAMKELKKRQYPQSSGMHSIFQGILASGNKDRVGAPQKWSEIEDSDPSEEESSSYGL